LKRKIIFTVIAILAALAACKHPTNNATTSYTVNFEKNHNDTAGWTDADPKTKTVTPPTTTIDSLPAAPTRTGYTFVDWKENSGDMFTASTPVNGNITVYAQWAKKELFTVKVNVSGNVEGDSVAATPVTPANAGDEITISYTVANTKVHNRLVFSGTKTGIMPAESAGTGTRKYTINAEDAAEGVITINAAFAHSDKNLDTIAFAEAGNVTKAYGDPSFTKAITNTGSGSGLITYTSSDPVVAAVDTNSGAVTILKVGTTTITATKAEDATYEKATAMYTLTVTKAAHSHVHPYRYQSSRRGSQRQADIGDQYDNQYYRQRGKLIIQPRQSNRRIRDCESDGLRTGRRLAK